MNIHWESSGESIQRSGISIQIPRLVQFVTFWYSYSKRTSHWASRDGNTSPHGGKKSSSGRVLRVAGILLSASGFCILILPPRPITRLGTRGSGQRVSGDGETGVGRGGRLHDFLPDFPDLQLQTHLGGEDVRVPGLEGGRGLSCK